MAHCEWALHKHADCVKALLRQGGSDSAASEDRCRETRQAYIDCRQAPLTKIEDEAINMVFGAPRQGVLGGRLPMLFGSKAPPACETELSAHGKCVEDYFRNSMTVVKGTDYTWLSHDGEEKCFGSRAAFEKCIAGVGEIASGRRPVQDRTVEAQILGQW